MRPALLMSGLALTACTATSPEPRPFAVLHDYAPSTQAVAQLPLHSNVGSVYQDYTGPAYAVRAAPPANDTGSERIPDFPVNAPPMAQGPADVIMPNGGERPVRSENALP